MKINFIVYSNILRSKLANISKMKPAENLRYILGK